jgi:hypothetical protein
LPIMLEGARAHAWVNDVLMYFLDEHAYQPDVVDRPGNTWMWIAGDGRADILIRSEWPIDHLHVTAESPIRTVLTMSLGAGAAAVSLQPGQQTTFDVAASGVRDEHSYAYLLSSRSTEGFTEHLRNPASDDKRNLGAKFRFTAIPKPQ